MVRFSVVLALALAAMLVPPAHARDLWGITTDDELIRVDPEAPAALVGDALPITGLEPGEGPRGLATYVTALQTLTTSGSIARLDPTTGQVEYWMSCGLPSTEQVSFTRDPAQIGAVTVDPGDAARSVRNLPCVPSAGADPIAYDSGPSDPNLVATAFHREPDEAVNQSKQYAVDAGSDKLVVRQSSDTWTEIGALGIDVPQQAALEATEGVLYLAAGGVLYTVDHETGQATSVDALPGGVALRDMTEVPVPRIIFGSREWAPGDNVVEGATETTLLTREGDPLPQLDIGYSFSSSGWNGPTGGVPGEDFMPQSGTVTFAPGQRRVDLPLPNVDDDVIDEWEGFYVNVTGSPAGNPQSLTVGIIDDDLAIEGTNVSVPESVGTIDFRGGRDTPFREPSQLVLAPTSEASASVGEDFTAPLAIPLAQGATSGTVTVAIVNDGLAEGDERIVLQQATSAPFSRMTKRFVIEVLDDDRTACCPPGPGPDPRPGPDTTAPAVTLSGARTLRLGRRGPAVAFTCSEACSATVGLGLTRRLARRLRAPRRLANVSARGLAGRRKVVRLRISRRTLKRLRKGRRVRAALTIAVRDVAGNARTVRRAVTLTR